ncbi:MAG TPA: DUF4382 domain-containing protein [Candidatus Thermoplasmatota archaeon]|nr:DUF4382 domain-containing protein [Candidatus Thermoplasmatota archaeon]
MRVPILAAVLVASALAGCAADPTGTLKLHVTDAPDRIGDFRFLNVTVTKIVLHGKEADDNATNEEGAREYAPATGTFDLTKLTNGNVSTIFGGQVAAGHYKKLTLHVQDARGVLQNGTQVDVKAPSGRLFIKGDFDVGEGKETDFLFDINVKMTGDGSYQFEPNATTSGAGKKTKPAEAVEADKGK